MSLSMSTADDIATFFDDTVDVYDEWFLRDTYYQELLASIVHRLRKYRPRRILELGCGTGNLSILLGKYFPDSDVRAVDVSQELLGQAVTKSAAYPNVKFELRDMLGALDDLSDGTSVVANYSVHHLSDGEKVLLCKKLGEGLGSNDVALIGVVYHPPPPPPPRQSRT
jgi:trans-aconitate methyltransferase